MYARHYSQYVLIVSGFSLCFSLGFSPPEGPTEGRSHTYMCGTLHDVCLSVEPLLHQIFTLACPFVLVIHKRVVLHDSWDKMSIPDVRQFNASSKLAEK